MAKAKTPDTQLIPAVGYIRMSTDDQKDSPERQRGEIVAMAKRDGYEILRWYEDHGLTGTESKNRPAFQRLMSDISKGGFKAVLMYEQSRFSREGVFDAMAHWKILMVAGIKLVSVQRGEMKFDDLAGLITAIVGQSEAENESRKIAERSVSGKRRKAALGAHHGPTPWGFDREITDDSGNVVRRVASWERFRRPASWKSRLVPSSDPNVLDAVRYIFQSVIAGKSLRGIVTELNRRKLTTGMGRRFRIPAVKRIIANPVYTGLLQFGAKATGKFSRVGELIVVPNAHAAIISTATFEKANAIMDAAYRARGVCTPGSFPLSNIVVCGHCGCGMTGRSITRGERKVRLYVCDDFENCTVRPTVSADGIESMVFRLIAEHVLSDANQNQLADVIDGLDSRADVPSIELGQLQEVQSKIERAETNLALADGEDFSAIAKLLSEWRSQKKKLEERIRRLRKAKRDISTAGLAVSELRLARGQLSQADRRLVTVALQKTIQCIKLKREIVQPVFDGDSALRSIQGTVYFHPEIVPTSFPFDEGDLSHGPSCQQVADYIRKAGRSVRCTEIAEAMETHPSCILYHAKRAVKLGLVQYKKRGRSYLFEPVA